jgi:shikimate dehydrogenase
MKKFCSNCTDDAEKIDAINTIVKYNEKILGFNTDWEGVLLSLRNKNIDLKHQKILVIGAGNAAAAAIYGIKMFSQNSNISILNKSEHNAKQLAEKFNIQFFISEQPTTKQISNFDLIVITIPVAEKYLKNVDFDINSILFFADYTNREYFNFLKAKKYNLILGEEWLVNQAIPAFEYFYGSDEFCKKVEISEEIISNYLNNLKTTNIYLTGFSGSGKTSIGKKLAKKLNRNFVDIDEIIMNQTNKTISEIFEKNGEEYFRQQESNIWGNICKEKNQIVSLGGGTLHSKQNQEQISETDGFVIYIFSDLETSLNRIDINSRPILAHKNSNEIQQLFENRKSDYFNNSDMIILNSSQNTNDIVEMLSNEFSNNTL